MYPTYSIWCPRKKKEFTLLFGKSRGSRPSQCGSIFHGERDCQRRPAVTCFTLLQLPCQKLVNLLHLHQGLSEAKSSCMKKNKTIDSNCSPSCQEISMLRMLPGCNSFFTCTCTYNSENCDYLSLAFSHPMSYTLTV